MSTATNKNGNFEQEVHAWSGWIMLVVNIAIVIGAITFFIDTIHAASLRELAPFVVVLRILASLVWFVARPDHVRRPFHAAAERGARADPVRLVQGHGAQERLPLGEPVLLADTRQDSLGHLAAAGPEDRRE